MNSKKRKKRRPVVRYILILLLALVVGAGVIFGLHAYSEYTSLKNEAGALKDDLKGAVSSVQELDAAHMEEAVAKLNESREKLNNHLNSSFWNLVGQVPEYGEDVGIAKELLAVLEGADDDIFQPMIGLMKEYPLDELKDTENGLNVRIILAYLDFLDEMGPKIMRSLINWKAFSCTRWIWM